MAEVILALDFGAKKTGIAIGNTATNSARPLQAAPTAALAAVLKTLITRWQPAFIVAGLPHHMDGREHKMTRRARRLAAEIEKEFGLRVQLADERLTTAAARADSQEREVDAQAAALILQGWMNENFKND